MLVNTHDARKKSAIASPEALFAATPRSAQPTRATPAALGATEKNATTGVRPERAELREHVRT